MNYGSKKLISENLENWFVMDHILFGGIPQSYMPKPVYETYLQTKKTYIATLFEMYNFVGYRSKYREVPANQTQIEVSALKTFTEARIRSARLLVTESKKFGKILKESKKENLDTNIKKLKLSSLIEESFVTNQLKVAHNPNSFESPKFVLIKNCLTECKKELIQLSLKYFVNK